MLHTDKSKEASGGGAKKYTFGHLVEVSTKLAVSLVTSRRADLQSNSDLRVFLTSVMQSCSSGAVCSISGTFTLQRRAATVGTTVTQ